MVHCKSTASYTHALNRNNTGMQHQGWTIQTCIILDQFYSPITPRKHGLRQDSMGRGKGGLGLTNLKITTRLRKCRVTALHVMVPGSTHDRTKFE